MSKKPAKSQPKSPAKRKSPSTKKTAKADAGSPKRGPGRPPKALEAHELAKLLPEMTPSDFAALKADIATSGQRDPIVLLDGKILDGRHRYRACSELGITPNARDFDPATEGTPVQYFYSKALHRNLNDGQKACAAARIEPHFAKLAAERRNAMLKRPLQVGDWFRLKSGAQASVITHLENGEATYQCKDPSSPHIGSIGTKPVKELLSIIERIVPEQVPDQSAVVGGEAREQAGALFGVSGRYVSDAKLLLEKSPKLFEQAFNGTLPLSQAVREYRRTSKGEALKKKAATLPPVSADQCNVIVGDNLDVLSTLPRKTYRLIFEDGPYNIGVDYGKGTKHDDRSPKDFLDDAVERFNDYPELLTPDGSVFVLINHEFAAEYETLLKEAGLHMRGWITWHETFGNNCTNNFNRTSRRLLYATRSKTDFVFHCEAFNRPSARQVLHNDGRAAPGGKLWDDVWSIPRLVDNAKERVVGVPTQLPLALVQPIVAGCSDPGDLVLDPFNGSGTTGDACLRTGRKFTGIDKSKEYAELARARWAATAAESKGGKAS